MDICENELSTERKYRGLKCCDTSPFVAFMLILHPWDHLIEGLGSWSLATVYFVVACI